jgi:hypothetical protein
MTTGEILVVILFGAGLICSLVLFLIIRRHVRNERDPSKK